MPANETLEQLAVGYVLASSFISEGEESSCQEWGKCKMHGQFCAEGERGGGREGKRCVSLKKWGVVGHSETLKKLTLGDLHIDCVPTKARVWCAKNQPNTTRESERFYFC